ncbi:hypothetical protein LSTR_LSTR014774 [Laodelphax striatellus]|uniref:Uncharacterized protein n=1 Tax=Laodelphax striatellus TaxID=195883 RepID=A0A482XRV0_LAOST|nr:hypothetical protein LSTR_LSTR014774 [Laodelphax striatellus]
MMRDDDSFQAVGPTAFRLLRRREWPFLSKSVPATVFDLGTFGLSDRRLSPSATDHSTLEKQNGKAQ